VGITNVRRTERIEPSALPEGTVGAAHRKPYPDPRDPNCAGGAATKGLMLGTDFITDVLLISITVEPPLMLIPGVLATDVVLRTLCEAIAKAACAKLELEASELQAEYRPALTAAGRDGREAEIYLYDTLPGGAGFAQRVGRLGLPVFEEALRILEACPENCDRSCYRCLRSYKNKFEHDLLDRHLGSSLLRCVLTGAPPVLSVDRLQRTADLLYQDLERQGLDGLQLQRNQQISVPGLRDVIAPILATNRSKERFVIGIHGPLTPDDDPGLRELKEFSAATAVILVDELVIRRNLPAATANLIDRLG